MNKNGKNTLEQIKKYIDKNERVIYQYMKS